MELQRYLKRGAPTSPSPSSAHRQPSPKISGTPNVLGRSLSQTALMSAPEMEFFKFVQEFVSAVLKWWGGWRIRVQIWSRYTCTREETRWRNKLFLKWIDFVFGSLKKKTMWIYSDRKPPLCCVLLTKYRQIKTDLYQCDVFSLYTLCFMYIKMNLLYKDYIKSIFI